MAGELELAAQGWNRRILMSLCDVAEPWELGTVFQATDYPDYWNYNVVQVAGDPGLSAAELIEVADDKLAAYKHRRVDFLDADAAESVRGDFEAAGWKATRLVWMLHSEPLPPGETPPVEEVDYDAVVDLRREWNAEDFPDIDQESHIETAKGVSMTRGVRVLASLEDGVAVGFAQIEFIGGDAEITHVFVSAAHRGSGRGTAITRAAIEAAVNDVDHLWIIADDEDRPKELYRRLGFRPAWVGTEFLRLPES
jgi:ribosomal protein S18 acetylase RimI-like enzyme